MKQPRAITVAMIADPSGGSSWQAQIQMEYRNEPGKDVLSLQADDPLRLLQRCMSALDKKIKAVNGKVIKL